MSRNMLETLTGAFVLIVAASFLWFFMKHNTGVALENDHYGLTAKFDQADGIAVGTPVRISGVKVGVVTSETIDPNTYFAIVNFSVEDSLQIPDDTVAKISSEGLIGGKYLALAPGGSDMMLKPGGEVKYTQSSVNLETLIGKMIFSKGDNAAPKDAAAPAVPEAPAPAATASSAPVSASPANAPVAVVGK